MRSTTFALLFLVTVASAAAASSVRHLSDGFGTILQVLALPGSGAVISADGGLILIDSAGEVVSAKRFPSQLMLADVSPSGDILTAGFDVDIETREWALRVTKVSADMQVAWSKQVSLPPGMPMLHKCMVATKEGGAVIATSLEKDFLVTRIGPDGSVRWSSLLTSGSQIHLHGIAETSDGDIVAAGDVDASALLVRFSSAGELEWQRQIGRGSRFGAVDVTSEGDIIAAGQLNKSLFITRTNGSGEAVWQRLADTLDASDVRSMAMRTNGEIVIASEEEKGVVLTMVDSNGRQRSIRRLDLDTNTSGLGVGLAIQGNDILMTVPVESGALYMLDGRGDRELRELPVKLGDVRVSSVSGAVRTKAVTLEGTSIEAKLKTTNITSKRVDVPAAATAPSPASAFRGRAEERGITRRYEDLFRRKQFAELDAAASNLRNERTFSDPMRLHIGHFYTAISGSGQIADSEQIELLREWLEERPESLTARIGLSAVLLRVASERDGSDAALNEGRTILMSLSDDAKTDAHYWTVRVLYASELGETDGPEVARQAAAHLHDPEMFRKAAFDVLGSPADYVAFADEAARLTQSTLGEAVYTWIAYQGYHNLRSPEDYQDRYPFDWSRMRKGFEDIIRLSPTWLPSYHRFAMTARRYGDRAAARSLFRRPELEWYEDAETMWSSRSKYDDTRSWALAPVETFVEQPFDRWPRVITDTAFLVETPSGIIGFGRDGQQTRADGSTYVLKLSKKEMRPREPVFLVACLGTNPCTQTVLRAKTSVPGSSFVTVHYGQEHPPAL